jgi:hypothetical protein
LLALAQIRPYHPLLAIGIREIGIREIVLFETVRNPLGLGELIGIGVHDASLHESGKRLVVMLIPGLLQFDELELAVRI